MVALALGVGCVAGCFWRSYGARMSAHVDVLVGIARKAVDLVSSGRMTAETMPELAKARFWPPSSTRWSVWLPES